MAKALSIYNMNSKDTVRTTTKNNLKTLWGGGTDNSSLVPD